MVAQGPHAMGHTQHTMYSCGDYYYYSVVSRPRDGSILVMRLTRRPSWYEHKGLCPVGGYGLYHAPI